jgi:hypothetical protein
MKAAVVDLTEEELTLLHRALLAFTPDEEEEERLRVELITRLEGLEVY